MGLFNYLKNLTNSFDEYDTNVTKKNNHDLSGNVMSRQIWKRRKITLRESLPGNVNPYITTNFYISSYVCPVCNKPMYKTVFPIGGEPPINVEGEPHFMKRLFTCPTCKDFYTPIEGCKLSIGAAYYLSNKTDYNDLLYLYNICGSTQGRPDA